MRYYFGNLRPYLAALAWTIARVQRWAIDEVGVDPKYADVFTKEEIDGVALADMTYEKFREYHISGGAATKLFAGVKALFPEVFLPRSPPPIEDAEPPPIVSLWRYFLKDQPSFEVGEVIESFDLGVLMNTTTLFIRPCYPKLFDLIFALAAGPNKRSGALVIGTPGTGKSTSLIYCLRRLASFNPVPTVYFESQFVGFAWVLRPDGSFAQFPSGSGVPREFSKSSFYLFDPAKDQIGGPRWAEACTIVASSPNPKHYKEFHDRQLPQTLHMPTWSLEELNQFGVHKGIAEDKILERFNVFGGTLRSILDETDESRFSLENALSKAHPEKLRDLVVHKESEVEHSHILFHMMASDDFKSTAPVFASKYVRDSILKKTTDPAHRLQRLADFFNGLRSVPRSESLQGHTLEEIGHTVLSRPQRSFSIRKVGSPNVGTTFDIPANIKQCEFKSLALIQLPVTEPSYFVPIDSNLGAIDSLMIEIDGSISFFQTTVSLNHGINFNQLNKHLDWFQAANPSQAKVRLYFVVHQEIFDVMPKQDFDMKSFTKAVADDRRIKHKVQYIEDHRQRAESIVEQWVLGI